MQRYFYSLVTDKKKGIAVGLVKLFLFIISLIYGFVVKVLYYFHRSLSHHLYCKVISVGNITWGGTGKTPLVEMLARYLKGQGHKVAILSRGYKKSHSSGVRSDKLNYKEIGDEPYLLSKNLVDLPVLTGANRIKTGREAVEKYNVSTVILDDGFQYWRLYRDLEIVVIDATNPFGNRHLIPRGILRESFSSLKRADIFFLTKTDLISYKLEETAQTLKKINPAALIIESIHQPIGFSGLNLRELKEEILPLSFVSKKDICVVSSIGNPEAFFKCLENLGANIILRFTFLDHHDYTEIDLKNIIDSCQRYRISNIVTTEKDAVRLNHLLYVTAKKLEVFALVIKIKITKNEKEFFNRLGSLYKH